ncbi:hypothetical protein V6N13_031214 [Hibiscus sabdariffa]
MENDELGREPQNAILRLLLLWLLSHQHPPKEPSSAIAFICIGGLFLYLGRDCVSIIPKLRSIEVKNFSENARKASYIQDLDHHGLMYWLAT